MTTGDDGLFDELVKGFSLTGAMPESGTFPAKSRPAQISVQQLKESAVWSRKMIHTSCRRVASDKEIAHAVYQETLLKPSWMPSTIGVGFHRKGLACNKDRNQRS